MAKNWNADLMFPKDSSYVNRICAGQFKQSSGGNPMVVLTFEVLAPQEVEVMGEAINIAGVKCDQYYVVTVFDGEEVDAEKTKNARDRFLDLCGKIGIEKESINWDNIDMKPFIGKCVLTLMEAEVEEQRKTPTMAQIEAAKKNKTKPLGDVLTNPATGAKLVKYWPKIREIFAEAPEGAGANQRY